MKNTWRLTTDLKVLVLSGITKIGIQCKDDILAFCPIDDKSYQSNLLKELGKDISFKEIYLTNSNFKVKIDSEGNLVVKSNSFPKPDNYYLVYNNKSSKVDKSKEISYLISNLENEKGDFKKYEFEIAFSNYNFSVKFICEQLDIYKDCLNELNRRVKCELFKKSKTWKPGHRYDSIDESIIFLGKFKTSRIIDKKLNVSFTKDYLSYEDVYLYIDADTLDLNNEKSISDIFNNRFFSNTENGIKEYRKPKLMVDSGEVIKNDLDSFNIENIKKGMIDRILSLITDSSIDIYNSKEKISELIIYKSKYNGFLKDILLTMLYHSSDKISDNNKEVKDLVNKHLLNIIKLTILKTEDKNSFIYENPNSYNPDIDLIIKNISYRYLSLEWTKEILLEFLGKNINEVYYDPQKNLTEEINNEIEICKNLINNINSISFEEYYKLSSEIIQKSYYSRQRDTSNSSYYNLEKITIGSLFGNSELTKVLKTICKKAIETSGDGVNSFVLKNVGTRKNPLSYATIIISINNIIDYYNGIDNLPSNLKDNIKSYNFDSLKIDIDLDNLEKIN